MRKIGFDNEKYLEIQSKNIRDRIDQFGGKLYLEFGGKLFDDFHASRVLPGFLPDSKLNMLLRLKDQVEIIIAINSNDIESSKQRGDLGITYDYEVLRLIDSFRDMGVYVGSVVITQYGNQSSSELFRSRLLAMNVNVYLHYPIDNYPYDVDLIVSDEGFGKNDYVKTERPLVVVTAPGPGSGKMAVCLSQLYHEHKRGVNAGYAKFETFPVWNLDIMHPVNLAYEAATVDLDDVNKIDDFHYQAYKKIAVNYNRDLEIFPVLRSIFQSIYGECIYKSPTDMGVNMVGFCITDDDACCEASKIEILRRYYSTCCQIKKGQLRADARNKMVALMQKAGIDASLRPVIGTACELAEQTGEPATALELPDGRIITGRTKELLGSSAAMLLNALKALGNIPPERHLLSPSVIEPVQRLKTGVLGNKNPRLHTDEVLIALSICAVTDSCAALAMEQLKKLKGCEAHSSVILSSVDQSVFRKLGINISCEPRTQTKKMFF